MERKSNGKHTVKKYLSAGKVAIFFLVLVIYLYLFPTSPGTLPGGSV